MLNNKGFTLIELLAMMVILGIIMAVTVPNIIGITTANKTQTYAEDAKKFKNTVEYRLRGDDTLVKPTLNNHCVAVNLKEVAGSEYDNPPYDGNYLMDYSFVLMVKIDNQYKYYVQLVEELPNEEGYRGYWLVESTKLDGEGYLEELDEATELKYESGNPLGYAKTTTSTTEMRYILNQIGMSDVCYVVDKIYAA